MSTRAKIISRVICHEVILTTEQEQVAGRILRQAVVTLRKSHLATVQRAAEITGYCEDHIRYVLRENPDIARRHWSGRLLVKKRDIQRYAHRMKKRGYGPQS